MALARISSSSVFVGNVPYDANEDDLKEIFGRAGQVTSVRVVLDKDTKQPKGYAFIDFVDSASQQAAIAGNFDYNGRKLRVDSAERELNNSRGDRPVGGSCGDLGGGRPPYGGGPPSRGGPPPSTSHDPMPLPSPVTTMQDRMAQLREQQALEQAKAAASEAAERAEVGRLMETMTPLQLLHLVGEMQRLAVGAPEVARALVGENVQLALALQHAEFLVGLLEEPELPTDIEVKERAKSVREKLWSSTGGVPPSVPRGPRPLQLGVPGMMQSRAPPPPAGSPPGLQFITQPPPPGMFPGQPLNVHGYGHAFGAATALSPCSAASRVAPYPQTIPATRGVFAAPPGRPMATTVLPPGAATTPARLAPPPGLLERLVQLSPEQIDDLPHDQKVQLLQFLQTLPPA